MPRKNPPLLLVSPLTLRAYIVTRYRREKDRPDLITASEQFDVTDEVMAAADRIRAERSRNAEDRHGE